ncbi:MAG: PAS domain-containing protein, partial [Proteobacteria bacterium]|nr:PAS domain-containing protein [Pseudomonadota bacterium]
MTGSENSLKRNGDRPSVPRRPMIWAVATVALACVAAFLHLGGEEVSALALAVSGLALAAVAGLTWTLGAAKADDPVSRLLRSAADDSRDGLLITGADGSFVYANLAFHHLFHMAAETGGGGKVTSLDAVARVLEGEKAEAEFQRLSASAASGEGGRAEVPVSSPSGAVEWRRLTVSPVAAPEGGALWRVEDITARREVDAVRREQEANLADSLDLLPAGFFSADGEDN